LFHPCPRQGVPALRFWLSKNDLPSVTSVLTSVCSVSPSENFFRIYVEYTRARRALFRSRRQIRFARHPGLPRPCFRWRNRLRRSLATSHFHPTPSFISVLLLFP